MQLNHQISSQWLAGKSGFEDISIADLQNIVDNYPAFGLAQLFLAKKLKDNNEQLYALQLPKTTLRFSDVLWLNFLLADKTAGPEIEEEKENTDNDETAITEKPETDAIGENRLSSMLQAHAADFVKPVSKDQRLAIDTEPLYKIDYFASQGIIYTKQQDALGNKVKRFTDWLKDIKKTSSGAPQLNTTEEEEKQAADKAIASLKVEEILTEPMAEVLIQQNKTVQAIELYKKLSLLYPEKSAYFATKINSLQQF